MTATAWKSGQIKDIPIQIIDGDRSSRYPKRSEFQKEGVLFLNTTNIINNRLDLTLANFVTQEKFDQIRKGRLQHLDIVMTTRGSIGKLALFQCPYETGLINAQMLIMRADGEVLDSKFLFYLMCGEGFQAKLRNFSSGAAQPQIPITDLKDVEISYPPIHTQQKIAGILSAYDDLIANNLRRIKILEQMAQTVYREWFVNFRFPGHHKYPPPVGEGRRSRGARGEGLTDSELGPIPQGWEVKKLGDVIELAYGKGLKASERAGGDIPVYGSSGVVGYHNKYLVEGPGIIVGRKGNVGSVHWTDLDFYPIDTVFYVKTELSLHYVFYNLQTQNFINTDAAVPGLSRNMAYSLPFLVPNKDILDKFGLFVAPIFANVKTLKDRNANLRRTRDLLLPRLISGKLDVAELDINTGAA